jgi:hypothetical protein
VISVRLIPEKPSKGLLWTNHCCTFCSILVEAFQLLAVNRISENKKMID